MVVSAVLPNLGNRTVSALASSNLCVQLKVEGQEEYREKKSVREDTDTRDFPIGF